MRLSKNIGNISSFTIHPEKIDQWNTLKAHFEKYFYFCTKFGFYFCAICLYLIKTLVKIAFEIRGRGTKSAPLASFLSPYPVVYTPYGSYTQPGCPPHHSRGGEQREKSPRERKNYLPLYYTPEKTDQ